MMMGYANLRPKMSSDEGYRNELRWKSKRKMQRSLRVSITKYVPEATSFEGPDEFRSYASKEIARSRLRLHASCKTARPHWRSRRKTAKAACAM